MKANIQRHMGKAPICFENLPEKEKVVIREYMEECCTKRLNDIYSELQIRWIKLACGILAKSFGFNTEQCEMFLGNWTRMYKQTGRKATQKAVDEFIESATSGVFPNGFPEEFTEALKKL